MIAQHKSISPGRWQSKRKKKVDPEITMKGFDARLKRLEAENRQLRAELDDVNERLVPVVPEDPIREANECLDVYENQPNGRHFISRV